MVRFERLFNNKEFVLPGHYLVEFRFSECWLDILQTSEFDRSFEAVTYCREHSTYKEFKRVHIYEEQVLTKHRDQVVYKPLVENELSLLPSDGFTTSDIVVSIEVHSKCSFKHRRDLLIKG